MKTHKEHEKNTKTTQQKSTAAVHEDLSQLWWRGYAALDAHALLSLLASKLEATPSSHQDGFPDGRPQFFGDYVETQKSHMFHHDLSV